MSSESCVRRSAKRCFWLRSDCITSRLELDGLVFTRSNSFVPTPIADGAAVQFRWTPSRCLVLAVVLTRCSAARSYRLALRSGIASIAGS